jgi:glycosyltransferase involved in cell wall biosynthesis
MTEPIRVTHVITDLDTGGAEMMLFKLLSRIDSSRISSRVISLTDEGPIGLKIRNLGIPVTSLGMKPGSVDPTAIFKLAANLRRPKTDVVQTWMYHSDLIGGLAALLAGGIPTLWNIRNSTLDPHTSKASTRFIAGLNARLSYLLPFRVLVCSEKARRVHESLGFDRKKMLMIPNGFDLLEFQPDLEARTSLLEELNIDPRSPIVGWVGRHDPQKDLPTLVDAARAVADVRPDVSFVLCGDRISSDNPELVGWIQSKGLESNFHLLGRRSDIPKVTAGFDLAVSSSAYGEAFSNVIGEAMACGVPCVVTDVGDAGIIVADTGRVVAPRSPQSLAAAILELMNLPAGERTKMGTQARERILQNYDLLRVVDAYTQVYLEVSR